MKIIVKNIKNLLRVLAEKILIIETTIILFLVYYLILGPIAFITKTLGLDFLKLKQAKKSFWLERKKIGFDIADAKKMF